MAKKNITPTPNNTKKRFDEQEATEPEQLSLFRLFNEVREDYSQTFSYDLIPKNVYGKPDRIKDRFLENVERIFEMNKKRYRLTITPARIADQKSGQSRDMYPGKREEIVEDALRKMAASGQGAKAIFLDGQFTVIFTRKALSDELEEQGHRYSYQQIEEAIEILFKTSIEMSSEDGENMGAFHPIESYGFKGRDGESNTYVKFCALVTESIQNNAFRLINYKKLMSFSSVIARKLHKRMANNFTQAADNQTYNISLSTIFRDFGLNEKRPVPNKLVDVRTAFEELKTMRVIESVKERPIIDARRKNKINDYVFEITPHAEFTREVMLANKDVVRRERELAFKEAMPEIYKSLNK